MNKNILILLVILSVISCQSPPMDRRIAEHYKSDPTLFEQFRQSALQDQQLLEQKNAFVAVGQLGKITREKLEALELPNASLIILGDRQCSDTSKLEIEIIFNKNWHLQNNPCQDKHMTEGQHYKQGTVEGWGLGDGWFVWVIG